MAGSVHWAREVMGNSRRASCCCNWQVR
jgi:hypothetical protein